MTATGGRLPRPGGEPAGHDPGEPGRDDHGRPLYARVLRLRHTRMARWQAVLLFDVALVVGVLLALAEVASAWSPVVLPAAVAVAVKAYDLVAGLAGPLPSTEGTPCPDAALRRDGRRPQTPPDG